MDFSEGKYPKTSTTSSSKQMLSHVKSTATIKPSQVTLSPKYKEMYQLDQKKSAHFIDVDSQVDNVTVTSGDTNTRAKPVKPQHNEFKNTQGLQGSIYSASNSDIRVKPEADSKKINEHEPDVIKEPHMIKAISQPSKVQSSVPANRIREAKRKAEMLMGKECNSALFQYQFEKQNAEEDT